MGEPGGVGEDLGGSEGERRLSSDRLWVARNGLALERLWGEGT